MSQMLAPLEGLRVLVVEDEFLLAITLEEDLRGAGADVVGPFNELQKALTDSRRHDFDVAVLDVNLDGTMVYPLADELVVRRKPFLFLSGYSATNMPGRFERLTRIAKPYRIDHLIAELRRLSTAPGDTART
jgi:DNA-binding response OmpR family regulator